ncbi:MAG: hypothetical protein UY04_C0027G0003 [Parcubacteria group bacterium GW2011_GWA2_47_7]|nr:MAG: hypothetical protein UY04_C0027G0003 [Parcubacteria group bacterium GW2011_GWA2_47_7]
MYAVTAISKSSMGGIELKLFMTLTTMDRTSFISEREGWTEFCLLTKSS